MSFRRRRRLVRAEPFVSPPVVVAPPTFVSITPASGAPDSTRAVTITGTNFTGAATLTIGGTAATSVTVVDLTTITATLPSKSIGSYDLVLTVDGTTITRPSIVGYGAVPFFAESFVDGRYNNAGGFAWSTGTSRVSISSERSRTGTHSLRFSFGPNAAGGDSTAEQRFNIGQVIPDLYIEYYLWIPIDYFHRSDTIGSSNNKFLALWNDDYGTASGNYRVIFQTWPTSAEPGASRMDTISSGSDSAGGSYIEPKSLALGGTGPGIVGAWNRIRVQVTRASVYGASDGVIRMWINDTLLRDFTDRPLWNFYEATPESNVGIQRGYLLGWSNSGFTEETVLYIDDISFYNANPGWN